jgi:hypothetical protein
MTPKTVVPMLLALVAVACGDTEGPDRLTTGVRAASEMPSMAERYQMQSKVDLTGNPGYPSSAGAAASTIHDFNENPGKTMIDAMKKQKVPIASTVLSKVPGPLQSSVEGWVSDEIKKVDALEAVEKNLRSALGKFEVLSTLEVPASGSNVPAKHTVTGLSFLRGDERVTVDAEEVESDPSATIENGQAKLGDHSFSLPVGSLIGQAFDLKSLLGKVVDCDAVAKNVAKRCLLSVCVGHETELKEMCETGLEIVADLALQTLKEFKLDPLHLIGGTLKLPIGGNPGDVLSGVWNGAADLGKGESPLVSKITGKKL